MVVVSRPPQIVNTTLVFGTTASEMRGFTQLVPSVEYAYDISFPCDPPKYQILYRWSAGSYQQPSEKGNALLIVFCPCVPGASTGFPGYMAGWCCTRVRLVCEIRKSSTNSCRPV